jgi:hypothetical protein
MALLYFTRVSTCTTLAETLADASHDRLTRMLHGTWSGQTLLDLALRPLFPVAGGYLIVEDTVREKVSARCLGEAAWVWSNTQQRIVFGVSVVLLVWTNGPRRIPLAFRVWHKGGPSKYVWAVALLSSARNRRKCQPQLVLCDSWYPAKPLLKRLRDSGGSVVGQLQKHRRFEGQPFPRDLPQPYWPAVGPLAGARKVRVVRYRRKYDVTNRLSLTAKEVRAPYRQRHAVEAVLSTVNSQWGLESGQAGDRRAGAEQSRSQVPAQAHHVALCLVASLIVERERLDRGLTWYRCKRQLILQGRQLALPALERVRKAA